MRLNKWLSNLMMTKGVDLFRSKGILAIQGSDDKYAPAMPWHSRALNTMNILKHNVAYLKWTFL